LIDVVNTNAASSTVSVREVLLSGRIQKKGGKMSGQPLTGDSTAPNIPGVKGTSESTDNSFGVVGFANGAQGFGVSGNTAFGAGTGVHGHTSTGVGVLGTSDGNGQGGKFFSPNGFAVLTQSDQSTALVATSKNGQAISAFSDNDIAIFAQGANFSGVFNGAFVVNKGPTPKHPDIDGSIVINDGNLFVNKGDVILGNGDCAEDFPIADGAPIDPGTVMVLDADGQLRQSAAPYDKRVAGVISGAGGYKPGLILDRQPTDDHRLPLALMGKVCCKVDARSAPIEVGDLLTTSSTPGHAMKAEDPQKAFGAVIGKALKRLEAGEGLIPILVALQ